MPNIWICGFSEKENARIRELVNTAIEELGLSEDAITSIIEMKAEPCRPITPASPTRTQPYIRICSSGKEEIQNITRVLKKMRIGVDVEWLLLDGFLPASAME